MVPKRLAAREVCAASIAAVFVRLVMNALLVLLHVPQLGEAFTANGAEVRFLPRVNASVNL